MKMLLLYKTIFLTSVFMMIFVITGCGSKYVQEDIDDIIYAEPTKEAKNFNIEEYIETLPEVQYEKIDYPVKEIYTYKFNNYELTVDIPEGFEMHKILLEEDPNVFDSTDLESSFGENGSTFGPGVGDWSGYGIISDNQLCIQKVQNISIGEAKGCAGLMFTPRKSAFKGVSYKDIMMHHFTEYTHKHKTAEESFFVKKHSFDLDADMAAAVFLDDNQGLSIDLNKFHGKNDIESGGQSAEDRLIAENYYFNILNSIKIQNK